MSYKRKCPECNGCMIQVFRNGQLYWHCAIPCSSYYKALPQGKLELVENVQELLKGMKHGETFTNSEKVRK